MLRDKPIRILQILNQMDYGGIEAIVLNYYRHINTEKVQFDFAVSEISLLPERKDMEQRGAHIYLLPKISNAVLYYKALKDLIIKNQYEIVHCHMNTLSVFPLFVAFGAKVPVRICHNHTTAHLSEGLKSIIKYVLRPFCSWFATDYFACSQYAGKWMFGEKKISSNQVYIMENAIDMDRFVANSATREMVRKKLNIENNFVVGHVGRFVHQKNHEFLIDIFNEIYKKNDKAKLLLVGEGDLEEKIKSKVEQLGLADAVIFYGPTRQINELYQAMDIFVFPSFYEGLGMVVVEAQCCGLPVYVSEAVPQEANISSGFNLYLLEDSASTWADNILKKEEQQKNAKIEQNGRDQFDIIKAAKRLEDFYISRLNLI